MCTISTKAVACTLPFGSLAQPSVYFSFQCSTKYRGIFTAFSDFYLGRRGPWNVWSVWQWRTKSANLDFGSFVDCFAVRICFFLVKQTGNFDILLTASNNALETANFLNSSSCTLRAAVHFISASTNIRSIRFCSVSIVWLTKCQGDYVYIFLDQVSVI